MHRFMDLKLEAGPGVLAPRQETELLGRRALALLAGCEAPVIVDMCCGSGNLALGLASRIENARVVACDLTQATIDAARRNAERLGLSDRVRVLQGDLFGALDGEGLEGGVDLVVCNPPYISEGRLAGDRAHLLETEPREAFDGGPYGISIHQRLVRDAVAFLRPGGVLAFEFGEGQERQARALLARARAYEDIEFAADLSGAPRVAIARRLS